MVLDFGKLESATSKEAILEPRKVFATLPSKDAKFKFLHDVQSEVLNEWFKRRNEKDLVIKMNTGSGKTLVGLLLLQSSLNEGCGPAVYVAPDNFLVEQIVEEANALGIAVTNDASNAGFISSQHILVINIHKLFNGRSVFGVGNEGRKIHIGTVVIDDAHACLATVREQFTLRFSYKHPAYDALFPIFKKELEQQSPTTLLDVEQLDPQAVMQVPFWVWQEKQSQILSILHEHRATEDFMFKWSLVGGVLKICRCAIGNGSIEIAPRCTPVEFIPSFDEATRRIHTTATLADDSVLVTEFQADPNSVATPITPSSAGDIGDRMILSPQEISPSITDEELKGFIVGVAATKNVVVIVPSESRSKFWADVSTQTLMANDIWDGVAKLKQGKHAGITVLVNRYDGIDLPGDACRLLVIDSLPEYQGLLERLDNIALDGTDVEASRQIQRIEQGMGRGVRSNDDHCVVILMGRRLVQRLHNPDARQKFTPGTLAQLDLAKEVADQLKGKPLNELNDVIDLCLNQDANWVSASKKAVVGASYVKNIELNTVAICLREAFDLLRIQQPKKAAEALQSAVNSCTERKTKGWLMVALAEVVHGLNPREAQEILLSALTNNRQIIRPIEGIAYAKLNPPDVEQAIATVAFLGPKFLEGNEFVISMNSIIDDLKFQPRTSNRFEAAIKFLGGVLGFGSQRPEAEFGFGPDNLWAVGGQLFFVIECKNGVITSTISKHDSDQLSGSMNWFSKGYDKTCSAIPVMIHPSHTFIKQASPHEDTRIIDGACLEKLQNALQGFATAAAKDNAFLDASKVGPLLDYFGLTAGKFIDTYSVYFQKAK